ncbi:MAG: nucleoside hydrolase, partial [Oscillospiraceae bacterium]|nr:nucleoside hydrolase [Oscillospiraceae bacterium]
MLDFFCHKYPGLPLHSGSSLHDACAVAWVIDEQIVQGAALHVDVELTGTLTRGMSVCDFRHLQTYKPDEDVDLESPFTNDSDEDPQFRGEA